VSTWKGWQADLLRAWGAPSNPQTRAFLAAWYAAVDHGGHDNPLGASRGIKGSSNYHGGPIKNYPTPRAAVAATIAQVKGDPWTIIYHAVRGGTPSEVESSGDLNGPLEQWGVDVAKFSTVYDSLLPQLGPPPSTTPGVAVPPGAAKAWRGIMRVFGRNVPKSHDEAKRLAKSYRHIFD
jgi:hypothetical protein